MRRAVLLSFLLVAGQLQAGDLLDQRMATLHRLGEAKYSYMFWHIYDVTLYGPESGYSEDDSFALSITYARNFSGRSIADQSSKLMRRQGCNDEMRLAAWHTQMDQIFPDVSEGETLIGLYTANGETVFYHDGEEVGRILDTLFGKCFFGIWLSESTAVPDLRSQLLGSSNG